MAWLELDDGIWEHHKTAKLCAALKISEVQCVGHLISLWHFVLRNAWRDANLEAWGEDGIEKAARWYGKKGEFIKETRNCGIIDGFFSHGWMERAGRLVYDRLRKEAERAGTVHKLSRTKSGLSMATVPNSTVPNRTEEKNTTSVSAKAATARPTFEQVTAYCAERGGKVNPDKWFAHYESNGWRVGKNPMKDWKAAVRTWEHSDYGGTVPQPQPTKRYVTVIPDEYEDDKR